MCCQSDPAGVRAILADGLATHPDDSSLLYNLACVEALDGHADTASAHLRRAIQRRPETADWARDDADLRAR